MRKQRRKTVKEGSTAPSLPVLRALATPNARSPATDYIAGLAPGSRRAQAQALVRVATLFGIPDPERVPWGELRPAHVDWLRAQLADQAAPATCNRVLSALRGTLRA